MSTWFLHSELSTCSYGDAAVHPDIVAPTLQGIFELPVSI